MLPADQARPPAQAATESLHQDKIPGLDPPVCNRLIEGERDRGGGGIGVAFDRHHHLVFRQAELSSDAVDDPAVGLVRNEPVDIRRGETVRRQRLVDHGAKMMNRLTEYFSTFHPEEAGISCRRRPAVDIEDVVLASVRVQMVGQDKAAADRRSRHRLQHYGASPVAEQDASTAILPVDDAGKCLRSDYKGSLRLAETNRVVGDRKREDEARANADRIFAGIAPTLDLSFQPYRNGSAFVHSRA